MKYEGNITRSKDFEVKSNNLQEKCFRLGGASFPSSHLLHHSHQWCSQVKRKNAKTMGGKAIGPSLPAVLFLEKKMKYVKGNLIDLAEQGEFDIIIHGCNCFCTMGRGIAKEIRSRYPEAYEVDSKTTPGDRSKLGKFTWAAVQSKRMVTHPFVGVHGKKTYQHPFVIINAYTQYDYRGKGVKCDYDAIGAVFDTIGKLYPTYRIAYPLIGAGLARGDWSRISAIINEKLNGLDHTLVTLENNRNF